MRMKMNRRRKLMNKQAMGRKYNYTKYSVYSAGKIFVRGKNMRNEKRYTMVFVVLALVCLIAIAGSGCLGGSGGTKDNATYGNVPSKVQSDGWKAFDDAIKKDSYYNSYNRGDSFVVRSKASEFGYIDVYLFTANITYTKDGKKINATGVMWVLEDDIPIYLITMPDDAAQLHYVLFYSEYANDYQRWKDGELSTKPNIKNYENEAQELNDVMDELRELMKQYT